MIRGALTSLIYISALKADAVASGGQNTAALTLVGPDVMNISGAFESLHEIWANPIEIVLSIWLLARELGAGAVGPAVSVIGEHTSLSTRDELLSNALLSLYGRYDKTGQIDGPSYQTMERSNPETHHNYVKRPRLDKGGQDAGHGRNLDEERAIIQSYRAPALEEVSHIHRLHECSRYV